MTSPDRYTPSEAAEIKRLLDQRLHVNRNEQKRIRVRLRKLGFRISDFEVGLTPAGFDTLALRGRVSAGAASQAAQPFAPVPPAPASSDAGPPEPNDGRSIDAIESVVDALLTRPWTFDEAVSSCPRVPGLYAIHVRGLAERTRVWRLGAARPRSAG